MSTVPSQVSTDPDWFLVSPDGSSATRIMPGLRIGETELGVLALNDAAVRHQLIRFEVSEGDGYWLELLSADHKMVTRDGASIRRERVSAGLVIVLPNHRLVISPSFSVCNPNGSCVEITAAEPAEVPPPAIRPPVRRPDPARRRRLGWPIAVVLIVSAAVAITRYPVMRDAIGARYAAMEDAVRGLIAGDAARAPSPAVQAPITPPAPDMRSEAPSPVQLPPADVADVPDAREAPEAAAQPPGRTMATVETQAPDRRLALARRLLNDGFIIAPPGRNAVALLGSLLTDHPAHAEGLALLEECASRLIDQAVSAKRRGDDFQARNTLEEVLSFSPGNERALRLQREWLLATY